MTVPTGFFEGVCSALGLYASPGRLRFFNEWARWENTEAKFNCLATTMPGGEDPNAPYWNTFGPNGEFHVRNYSNMANGVAATAATIKQANFTPIRNTLANEDNAPGLSDNIRLWGTTGFADLIDTGWNAFTTQGQKPALSDAQRITRLENIVGGYGIRDADWNTLTGEAALAYADKQQYSAILSGQLAGRAIAQHINGNDADARKLLAAQFRALADALEAKP